MIGLAGDDGQMGQKAERKGEATRRKERGSRGEREGKKTGRKRGLWWIFLGEAS